MPNPTSVIAAFPRRTARLWCLCLALAGGPAGAAEFEWRGSVGVEGRAFLQSPRFASQEDGDVSLQLAPELHGTSGDGKTRWVVSPWYRQDSTDPARSHFDLRELALEHAAPTWELRLGVRRVFWGVAESNHLVDVLNQTDQIENPDQEDKLGQPMANLALIRPWGTVDLYVLPWFRERTFPGKRGRLRERFVVDPALTTYESPAREHHVDFAVRYSLHRGGLDLGLYQFKGTSREPLLLVARRANGRPLLRADYRQIDQTGLDAQYTWGNWLFKLEALHRTGFGPGYSAVVSGFEYTLVGVAGSPADLGLLLELNVDQRGKRATSPFNHDLFAGFRLGLNDMASTSVLAGVATDVTTGSHFVDVEAERRIGERWKLEVQCRAFLGTTRGELLDAVAQDAYVSVGLDRYF